MPLPALHQGGPDNRHDRETKHQSPGRDNSMQVERMQRRTGDGKHDIVGKKTTQRQSQEAGFFFLLRTKRLPSSAIDVDITEVHGYSCLYAMFERRQK